MWPGQQPPGGEQNPQQQHNPYQQPGYQQPNPYQQPGFQQPNTYPQQPQWGAPGPAGPPGPPPGDGGNRTKVVAIVAALAVVVAAGVTGFLVLGGDDKENVADGKDVKPSASASEPSASPSEDDPRGGDAEKATISGWKIVVNPKWGTAFDVPADWEVQSPRSAVAFEEENSDDIKPIITMSAPAILKSKWCESDDDKDGNTDTMSLAATGTKGANGAKDTDEIAINTPAWWVYGGYTQPDKKSITLDKKATPYTTTSGVEGSYAWASSKDTPAKGKCVTDGKAITFGFKNSAGDFVSWNFYGAKGVDEEVSKETIMKILSTVRLHGEPTG
ncbi:hypothetical protein [Streptomyces resistomycificus]|uniref:Membrane protein n=1 Tax=Streptomyces resistomycificus TaxID=67356 RepID=A0A0L8L157_9ACTN|nr:hypothetical protein [Streptomyces resistomycificus]KOG31988.1 membrane protein [Streptomyces resistomycificus]KUO00497.1 hypothetical protein AQJ84_05645 [Streptomyces resistomycificus]